MTALGVIRYADGRTVYRSGSSPIPPTNPKAGTPTGGNTVIWNERTRDVTLIVPRQNPVKVDSWSPKTSQRASYVPTTYEKPPSRSTNLDANGRSKIDATRPLKSEPKFDVSRYTTATKAASGGAAGSQRTLTAKPITIPDTVFKKTPANQTYQPPRPAPFRQDR